MAKKRLRKKREKERLQREIVASQKIEQKNVKKQSYRTLISISNEIKKEQREQEKRAKRQQYNKDYRQKRRQEVKRYLESKGIDPFKFKLSQIDKIKLKDIRNDRFNRDTYPEFYGIAGFDFDKLYKLKDGEEMYFAFRDFTGEMCFADELNRLDKYSSEQLLDMVWQLAKQRPTYNKREKRKSKGVKGGSSGSAGDFKYICMSKVAINDLQKDVYNSNRRKRTKQHSGTYRGFQVLKNGGRNTFKEVSPRGLLKIAVAIMSNVTEYDRIAFYRNLYKDIQKHIAEFVPLLPSPLELD